MRARPEGRKNPEKIVEKPVVWAVRCAVTMNLTCTNCHMSLPSEDATATHCRHCRAPLPHGEAAAQQQAMMRNFMAQHQAPAYVVAPQPAAIVYGGGSQLGAMITKSVHQSVKMSLWMTLAGIGVTFLVTGILIVAMLLR